MRRGYALSLVMAILILTSPTPAAEGSTSGVGVGWVVIDAVSIAGDPSIIVEFQSQRSAYVSILPRLDGEWKGIVTSITNMDALGASANSPTSVKHVLAIQGASMDGGGVGWDEGERALFVVLLYGDVLTWNYYFFGDVTFSEINRGSDITALTVGEFASGMGANLRAAAPAVDVAVGATQVWGPNSTTFGFFGPVQAFEALGAAEQPANMRVTDAVSGYACPCIFFGDESAAPSDLASTPILEPGRATFSMTGAHAQVFMQPLLVLADIPDPTIS